MNAPELDEHAPVNDWFGVACRDRIGMVKVSRLCSHAVRAHALRVTWFEHHLPNYWERAYGDRGTELETDGPNATPCPNNVTA